jgi:hypothetical protein
MNSSEVYATLKGHMASAFQAAGCKRAKAMLSWTRPQRERFLVVWFQVSRDGWDSYAGSRFTVEFQLSDEPIVGARSIRRQRFPSMLDASGREEIRRLQNDVIASLHYPPPNHPVLKISEPTRAWYVEKFRKIDQPYAEKEDIWFRYGTQEHVTIWANFITRKLPDCFRQAESWG